MVITEDKVNMRGPDSHQCFQVGDPGIIEGAASLPAEMGAAAQEYQRFKRGGICRARSGRTKE
jgi:hypothetical protein